MTSAVSESPDLVTLPRCQPVTRPHEVRQHIVKHGYRQVALLLSREPPAVLGGSGGGDDAGGRQWRWNQWDALRRGLRRPTDFVISVASAVMASANYIDDVPWCSRGRALTVTTSCWHHSGCGPRIPAIFRQARIRRVRLSTSVALLPSRSQRLLSA